jgi:hypothetical protein
MARRDPLLVAFGRSIMARALRAIPEFQTILAAMKMPRDRADDAKTG